MFNFTPDVFMQTLPIMGKGLLGIFAVMLVIYLVIALLQKLSNK